MNSTNLNKPFNVRLRQLEAPPRDGTAGVVKSSMLLSFSTLNTYALRECVYVWNLPVSALQRKIGELGRFCTPDGSIIDNPLQITLLNYTTTFSTVNPIPNEAKPLDVFWIKIESTPRPSEGESPVANGTASALSSWDYVFQANGILNCSYIELETSTFKKAPLAAFRILEQNEDDADATLPQDDQRAKIPTWALSAEPSRTFLTETMNKLETSAVETSHSKSSFSIGLNGAFKAIAGDAKYEREKERSDKDERSYGREERSMILTHEIPIVEITLHKGNVRLSEKCRQLLLQLRTHRRFQDLLQFYTNYGTIYASDVVLGGRLLNRETFSDESSSHTVEREVNKKQSGSVSIGIKAFGIEGGYSNEKGWASSNTKKEEADQDYIDWSAYGGNAALASDPNKWKTSLSDYHYWEIIRNVNIEAVQDFIGKMPGYDDIPGLFDAIAKSGVYDPTAVPACMGPQQVLYTPSSVQDLSGMSFLGSLGSSVHVLEGVIASVPAIDYGLMKPWADITDGPSGGMSWRVFDSVTTTQDEVEAMSQVLMSTGINRRCASSHLYNLSMQTNIVTVVLQWTGDAKNYAFANDHGSGYIVQGSTLSETFKAPCEELSKALKAFNAVSFAENGKVTQAWKDASTNVTQKIDALNTQITNQLDVRDPRRTSVAQLMGLWTAASKDLISTNDNPKFADRSSYDKVFVPIDAIDMMRKNVAEILRGGSPANQTGFGKWIFSDKAKQLLNTDNPADGAKAFLNSFGQYVVDGYNEAPMMTAVWRIELNAQQVLLRRVDLERYFATARTVSEVCDYFAYGIKDAFGGDLVSVHTAIYGYKKPGSSVQLDLHDIDPAKAKYYLITEALNRNLIRFDFSLRAYRDLLFDVTGSPKVEASWTNFKGIAIPEIASEYLLGLQKIMAYLFTLKAYAKEVKSGIQEADVKAKWLEFNQLELRKNLQDDGSISDVVRQQINNLREALETMIQGAEAAMRNIAPEPYMAFASLPYV